MKRFLFLLLLLFWVVTKIDRRGCESHLVEGIQVVILRWRREQDVEVVARSLGRRLLMSRDGRYRIRVYVWARMRRTGGIDQVLKRTRTSLSVGHDEIRVRYMPRSSIKRRSGRRSVRSVARWSRSADAEADAGADAGGGASTARARQMPFSCRFMHEWQASGNPKQSRHFASTWQHCCGETERMKSRMAINEWVNIEETVVAGSSSESEVQTTSGTELQSSTRKGSHSRG
jgi:hypothetical protein